MPESPGSSSSPAEAAKRLQQALGLPPTEHVDAASAAELAAMLVEFATAARSGRVEHLEDRFPQLPLKRADPPGRPWQSSPPATRPPRARLKIRQDLERLRQLTAALTASVNQAGRVFAQKHVETFAPAQIEQLAKVSGGASGVLVGHEVKCWRKYVELAAPHDAQSIERDLLGAMSGYAESLLKGLSK